MNVINIKTITSLPDNLINSVNKKLKIILRNKKNNKMIEIKFIPRYWASTNVIYKENDIVVELFSI